MSGTTIATTKAYLFAQIPGQVADSTVLVAYDLPAVTQPDDFILVGCDDRDGQTAEQATSIVGVVGAGSTTGWLEEQYDIPVGVFVFRGGADFKTTFERAVTLTNAVCASVRADPSLGGTVLQAYPAGASYRSYWADDHKGTLCDVSIRVRVNHHI